MCEAVVILPPNRRGDQQIQGGVFSPPRQMVADGEPLGMLVEHGINDVDKRFVRGEKPMPASEQIAFEHAFDGVLTEHFDSSAVLGEFSAIHVLWKIDGVPEFLA